MAVGISVRVRVQDSVLILVAPTIQTTHRTVHSVQVHLTQKVSRGMDSASIVHVTTTKVAINPVRVVISPVKAVINPVRVAISPVKAVISLVKVAISPVRVVISSVMVATVISLVRAVISREVDMVVLSKVVISREADMVVHNKEVSSVVVISSALVRQTTIQMQSTARRNNWSTMTHFWIQMRQSA